MTYSHSKQYHCIIDLDTANEEKLADLMSGSYLSSETIDEIAEYLSQWDYGDYLPDTYPIVKDFNSRLYDCVVDGAGEYVLKVDTSMGTASLYIEAELED